MPLSSEKIISEALQLPSNLRALIAERLIESLDYTDPGGLPPEWQAEVARRCRQIDEETVQLIPAEKVMKNAFNKLK
ncbi:MAG: hypothetical protein Kow00100_19250 [Geothermobacteraceae bacterium]